MAEGSYKPVCCNFPTVAEFLWNFVLPINPPTFKLVLSQNQTPSLHNEPICSQCSSGA